MHRRAVLLVPVWVVTLIMLIPLAGATLDPTRARIEATHGESTISIWTDMGTIAFPGECVTVAWKMTGIRAVYLNERGTVGEFEENPCVFAFQPPTFRVEFPDETTETYALPINIVYPDYMRSLLVLALGVALGLSASVYNTGARLTTERRRYIAAFALAAAWVVALDVMTNALDIQKFKWDHVFYIALVDSGYGVENNFLAAPFAYRFTPALVRGLVNLGSSITGGFTIIAYVGGIMQLWLVFALARQLGASFYRALAVMLVVGLSFFNLKFLMFDVFRPDHLAFPLMALATIALLRRQTMLCIIASCLGLLFREYAIIIPLILAYSLLRDAVRARRWRSLLWIPVAMGLCGVVIIAPRMLIPVKESHQVLDPLHDPYWFETLKGLILSPERNLNVLLAVLTYLLPVLLLATPERLYRAAALLKPYRAYLLIYTALMLVFTLISGGDIGRYVAYFFLPQVFVLVVLLEHISWVEILSMLVIIGLVNRIPFMVPVHNQQAYLAFMVTQDVKYGFFTIQRWSEIAIAMIAAIGLRTLLLSRSRGEAF